LGKPLPEGVGADFEQRHLLEGLILLLPIEEIGAGRALAFDAVLQIRFPDEREAIGAGIGQGTEDHGINDAENCGIRTDAEREHQQSYDAEAGRFAQSAQGVAQIL